MRHSGEVKDDGDSQMRRTHMCMKISILHAHISIKNCYVCPVVCISQKENDLFLTFGTAMSHFTHVIMTTT